MKPKLSLRMKKVKSPRFADHVELGEKPKFKSFLLRMHQEDEAQDENDTETEGTSPVRRPSPRLVRSHPKKRMQFCYEEESVVNNNNNDEVPSANLFQGINFSEDLRVPPICYPVLYQPSEPSDDSPVHTSPSRHYHLMQSRRHSPTNSKSAHPYSQHDHLEKNNNKNRLVAQQSSSVSPISHVSFNFPVLENLPHHLDIQSSLTSTPHISSALSSSPGHYSNFPDSPTDVSWLHDVKNVSKLDFPIMQSNIKPHVSQAQDLRLPNNSRRKLVENLLTNGHTLPLLVRTTRPTHRNVSGSPDQDLTPCQDQDQQASCASYSSSSSRQPCSTNGDHYGVVPQPLYGGDAAVSDYCSQRTGSSRADTFLDHCPTASAKGVSSTLSARDKTLSWLCEGVSGAKEAPDSKNVNGMQNSVIAKRVDEYRRRPMQEWEPRDVAHFLIEATHELCIRIEDIDLTLLSKVNGFKLSGMEEKDLEKFAPGAGVKLFEYIRRHQNANTTSSPMDVQSSVMYSSQQDVLMRSSLSTSSNTSMYNVATSQHLNSQYYYQGSSQLPPQTTSYEPKHLDWSPANTLPAMSGADHFSVYPELRNEPSVPTAFNKTFNPLHNNPSSFSVHPCHEGGFIDPEHHMPSTINPSDLDDSSDDDDDEEDDEEDEEPEEEEKEEVKPVEPPKRRGPGRPPKPESERKKKKKKSGRLWEFIRNLLLNPETCPSIVKWEDAEEGIFRFVQSEKVAEKWGMRKNNQKMNYEKLSRAMRYYYKGKIFEPVLGRRLVYKFGVNAKGWKPNQANFGELWKYLLKAAATMKCFFEKFSRNAGVKEDWHLYQWLLKCESLSGLEPRNSF